MHLYITITTISSRLDECRTISGKDVGIAYKERVDKGIFAVSVRGSPSCKIHLGSLVSSVAAKFDGSGGGHDKACGAVIPKNKMNKFLREMNFQLGK